MIRLGSLSLLISHPTPNSGSEKSLGLYPGTGLSSARFFPALVKGDQAVLWSTSSGHWLSSFPTTPLHAPGILRSQTHPDVCGLLEVSLWMPRRQAVLLSPPLPGWGRVVTGKQSASKTLLFQSSTTNVVFFIWSWKCLMTTWFLLKNYFYKWKHLYILVDKISLCIVRYKSENKH